MSLITIQNVVMRNNLIIYRHIENRFINTLFIISPNNTDITLLTIRGDREPLLYVLAGIRLFYCSANPLQLI